MIDTPLAPFRLAGVLVDVGAAELRQAAHPTRAGLALTAAEAGILAVLGRDRGVFVDPVHLAEEIDRALSTVKTHMTHVRHKLRRLDPDAPAWLETGVHFGYRLRREWDDPRGGARPEETPDVGAVLRELAGMLAPPPETMGGAVLSMSEGGAA